MRTGDIIMARNQKSYDNEFKAQAVAGIASNLRFGLSSIDDYELKLSDFLKTDGATYGTSLSLFPYFKDFKNQYRISQVHN